MRALKTLLAGVGLVALLLFTHTALHAQDTGHPSISAEVFKTLTPELQDALNGGAACADCEQRIMGGYIEHRFSGYPAPPMGGYDVTNFHGDWSIGWCGSYHAECGEDELTGVVTCSAGAGATDELSATWTATNGGCPAPRLTYHQCMKICKPNNPPGYDCEGLCEDCQRAAAVVGEVQP